ncbi:MAG: hypothetical protein IPN66_09395 [Candidatus Competibacteraceae bacterium]|nr:hypothetical protein [Candidatus Competibacteraceae bacterium]
MTYPHPASVKRMVQEQMFQIRAGTIGDDPVIVDPQRASAGESWNKGSATSSRSKRPGQFRFR